jgi:hypothetical protein
VKSKGNGKTVLESWQSSSGILNLVALEITIPAAGGREEEEKKRTGGEVSFPRVALRLPWAVFVLLLQSKKGGVRIGLSRKIQ